MIDEVGFLSPSDLRRLVRIGRLVEQGFDMPGGGLQGAPNLQYVNARSSIPAGGTPGGGYDCKTDPTDLFYSGGSDNYYDSFVNFRREPKGVWEASGDVWLMTANGEKVMPGKNYLGKQVGWRCINHDTRPVFVCTLSGGGNVKMMRFQGPFVRDTAGSPSPWCYYPVFDQGFTSLAKSDLDAFWAFPWYGITPVPGVDGDPATIVKVDGTAAHLCLDAGFEYSPGDSASSRRVFVFDAFSAAYDGGCRIRGGHPGFGTDNEG